MKWYIYIGGKPDLLYVEISKQVALEWKVEQDYFFGDCTPKYHYKQDEFEKMNQPVYAYLEQEYGKDWGDKFTEEVERRYANRVTKKS